MLHLHAVAPVATLGLLAADAFLVSTSKPGKAALVRLVDCDFQQVANALEHGQLANVGEPLECQEVEDFVKLTLEGADPPSTASRARRA